MQLHAQEQLSKISHTFVCKKCFFLLTTISGKIADKYVENLKQTSGEISAQVRPQILCCVALAYNSYHCYLLFYFFFFRTCVLRKLFEKLYSHTNTHALAYPSR